MIKIENMTQQQIIKELDDLKIEAQRLGARHRKKLFQQGKLNHFYTQRKEGKDDVSDTHAGNIQINQSEYHDTYSEHYPEEI